jgi:hypothetical protein
VSPKRKRDRNRKSNQFNQAVFPQKAQNRTARNKNNARNSENTTPTSPTSREHRHAHEEAAMAWKDG